MGAVEHRGIAGGHALHEIIPFGTAVRMRLVKMVVGQIAFYMETESVGRVVHHQTRGIQRLQPMVHFLQPGAMIAIFHQIGAPIFVDDGPDDDRWMIPIAGDHAGQGGFGAGGGCSRKIGEIGEFGPDEQAKSIGDGQVAGIGHFDVEADGVEAHRFGFLQLVFQIV